MIRRVSFSKLCNALNQDAINELSFPHSLALSLGTVWWRHSKSTDIHEIFMVVARITISYG